MAAPHIAATYGQTNYSINCNSGYPNKNILQLKKINMKKIMLTLSVLFTFYFSQAHTYSGWITADKNPTLQVRWTTKKDAQNYTYLMLQFISSVGCKFNVTATLCDKDAKAVNGWKAVRLIRNKQEAVFQNIKFLHQRLLVVV